MVSAAWQISWELCFLGYLGIFTGEMGPKTLNVWQKWSGVEQCCDGLALKMEAFCDLFYMFAMMLKKKKKKKKAIANCSTLLL